MAAKHFAGEVSPSWFEDDPLADIPLRFGRHFKDPEPSSASLETLTEQTDDPSDAVRRYIDQLTAELESQLRRPVETGWHAAKADDEAVVDKSIEHAESFPQIDEAGEDDELVESPLQANVSAGEGTVVRNVAQLNEILPTLDEPAAVSETAPEPEPVSVSAPESEPVPGPAPVSAEPLESQREELPEEEPVVVPSKKSGFWENIDAGEAQASADVEPFGTVESQPQVAESVPTATEGLDETLEFPAQAELLVAEPAEEPMDEPLDEPDEFEARRAKVLYVEPDLVEEPLSGSESRQLVLAAPVVSESDMDDELGDTAKLKRIEIPTERLVEQHQEQRIRVSTNLQEPKSPVVDTTALDKRRPLGFFARIGEFVARLLHLDDR